jgi:glyoxylase-like metal-dependent hydrolase (beta-lactamase superfamily II)
MPVKDRLVFIKDGQEFLPGIQALAAPGHTVGHHIFMISSGDKSFAFLGDLTHHQILLMEKPRMQFSYDTDPKQAADSRVRMLDMLAANKVGVRPCGQNRRGFSLRPRAHGDGALTGLVRGRCLRSRTSSNLDQGGRLCPGALYYLWLYS